MGIQRVACLSLVVSITFGLTGIAASPDLPPITVDTSIHLSDTLESTSRIGSLGMTQDRLWMFSTRGMQTSVCAAPLESPNFRVYQLDTCGRIHPSSLDMYLASRQSDRPTVVYVHGNRVDSSAKAIERTLAVYRSVRRYQHCTGQFGGSIDWVLWSWPSEREGFGLNDVRIKAARTDTQGLYLAWLLREHVKASQPTSMIGYSFGGRVITGALHAMAGGTLGRRQLPGDKVTGAAIDIGLVAPALENDWLAERGYHRLATQNLDSIHLLYNRRDVVLKNYWRLDRIRNADALGYSGPSRFASRYDGTRLPVRARDCAAVVGRHHSELDYYTSNCGAGPMMQTVIDHCLFPNP
ncbi:hypothetical protein [Crateriforma conspicua]|uniref:hypothetical protein n=1 Tax=Crateriforma conspicua TaxID=2527996 RepID=UPI00118D0817|nr:hypothetical protein [Crateriforma conspicua]QDV62889.1 hypothetical protein Mal65_20260 [Crateriforma conspicua]